MKQIKITLLIALVTLCTSLNAQNFNDFFENKTLRLDYIFSGNAEKQNVSISELNVIPNWYGKKQNLSQVPIDGNGQVIVRSKKTNEIIYKNSFSTLFQEWITFDEAKTSSKSFENVFLVPYPKDTALITLELYNNRRTVIATYTHTFVPNDILIRKIGDKNVTPYVTVQEAKDKDKCIHVAYVAEGYTEAEMDVFMRDVEEANNALFAHEPFKGMKDRFNVIAVKAVSQESGTSTPSKGVWKNTALHSHFDTFYSNRYLTTLRLYDLHNILAGTPYEHIIVLVNTDEYGGGGILNSYNLSMTHHKLFKPVVVHEFGHSFAGLGDEYAYEHEQLSMYPLDIEPWEKNITTLVDFNGKWEKMIDNKTPIPTPLSTDKKTIEKRVGVFEGAGYQMKGVYRGCQDCRMRTNTNPEFCPVCEKAIAELINFYTK